MAKSQQLRASYDDWAKYFDLIAGDRTPMAVFYRSLIGDKTRSILELGCGTGTITLALVQRLVECGGTRGQYRVVGVDESAEMLRIARGKDRRPEWLLGDMRLPPIEGTFDLVICCYNTVQSLLTGDELAEFFCSVRSIVNPDGVFAFDIVQPDLQYLSKPHRDHPAFAVTDERKRRLVDRRDHCYDPRSRVLAIEHRLIEVGGEAAGPLARVNLEYRQYVTAEINEALAGAGFAVHRRCGAFDGSQLTAASKKQIFVCSPV
jgi:SAM-dependent methyltransferase